MPADLEIELTAEREHLAASRSALRRMREHAEALFATGDKVAGDSYTAEQLGRHMARRVLELADDPSTPLFFGRLDFGDGEHAGHGYHVGRRHVTDEAGEPMVLDWRAPISRSFYRASVKDPRGVAVRRRFGFVEGVITSFEDEHLDRGEELGTASKILTQEIERPRVGPMRDIVATIQPEQDELVRADLADSLCVQGAPGTGKTAVGLHRAAYLLYLHRERLRRSGVLIVGPNRAFLGYIAAVLPALGEVEVAQSTVEDLIGRVPVRAEDGTAAAVVKHDARMAEVLRRAVWSHIGKPSVPMTVPDGSYRWRIAEEPLRRVVDEARREGLPYAVGRERVRARVVSLLLRQSEARRGDSPPESWQRRMAKAKPVTEFLDEVWPALTPEGLLHRLLTDPDSLREHAGGLLTDEEQAAIVKTGGRTPKSTRWTSADTVLMDEIAGLLDRMPSFGHVVLDEAQDLSPMQCRAIARRSEHGSITLLGDLAQGTAPWASADWAVSLAHLGKPGAPVVPLTVGFRVPAVVVELANRLLPALRVNVPPAESLRRDGSLVVRATTDLAGDLDREVRAALEHEGSVAVIAADASVAALTAIVPQSDRLEIVPASIVKGLEYDHVIVVEPAEIVDAEPRGLNRLYVVLTRAVSRLTVIHAVPLPEPLT
ncbi:MULTISPECIES: HelD family protein [Catenuloplanes]|uniref:DNA helicase IV n=1 Tax=Catenuloplanes niger TaxID=587534 RepID=A0AAE3ZNF9_9ACTN|nr:AAA family ATPase [Catenuloplanes niger]MDR7323163.1 DNA helicase IV [Catenuloplanes niger]